MGGAWLPSSRPGCSTSLRISSADTGRRRRLPLPTRRRSRATPREYSAAARQPPSRLRDELPVWRTCRSLLVKFMIRTSRTALLRSSRRRGRPLHGSPTRRSCRYLVAESIPKRAQRLSARRTSVRAGPHRLYRCLSGQRRTLHSMELSAARHGARGYQPRRIVSCSRGPGQRDCLTKSPFIHASARID